MKRLLVSALLIFECAILSAATIEKVYYFKQPHVSQKGVYQELRFEQTMLTSLPGQPALPYRAVSLLLPPGESAISIEFIGEDEIIMEGSYQLYPYQSSRPLSEPKTRDFQKDELVYRSNEKFPAKQTGNLSTAFMNGFGFAFSTFTPVKYKALSGTISYYRKVTIRIHTAPDAIAEAALKNLNMRKKIYSKVASLAQNPADISTYVVQRHRDVDDYKLLVITTEQFKNEFADLLNIYQSRGMPAEVASTEFIADSTSGQDLQEQIRNYIIQEYQNHGVEFVLLGGDVEYIPYRGFYCYVQSGGGYESNDIPADLYYSALDGTWDDDGDNKWGEPDEDDLLPEIAIARFPFSTLNELQILIHKSISYQNNPVTGELVSPLFAGEHLYSGPETWGRDYLDLLIGTRSDNGYTTTGIPNTYPIDSLYEHDQSWNGSDLMTAINQGQQFVHHVGHASPSSVAHLTTSDITNANFSGANGIDHNFTLFHTHGCDCGAFDFSDCILEKMVLIDNFAVAVVGNSRYGWFNEGQSEGPAAHLHREMMDAIYHDKINHLGMAMVESKIQTAPWVEAPGQHEEGALRWNFYDLNILGDPALSVWTNEPVEIDASFNNAIQIGTASMLVNVQSGGQPQENLSCTLMKDGVLHGYGITDDMGAVEIFFNPLITEVGEANLIISGYNVLPDTNQVTFIPAEGPYAVYAEHLIDDQDGNNNGLADYGETILLDLSIRNVGSDQATNASATLVSSDEYIVFLDEIENYGNVPAGDTVMVQQAFSFNIASHVPDQHIMSFQLEVISDEDVWYSDFEITAQAPQLSLDNFLIDDDADGNGNGRLDPDETAILQIDASNFGHSPCFSAGLSLETTSPWMTIETSFANIGDLMVDETKTASFEVSIDEFAPQGTPTELSFELISGDYINQRNIAAVIGLLMEDFESGDFTAFEWRNSGQLGWTISEEWPFEGSYCSKSGSISDMQQSDLFITLETLGESEVSFCRKVSSEQDWDFLHFFIDGDPLAEWSGEQDWESFSYPLSSGTHTLMWSYIKDQNTIGGSDCAWLDNIVFPSTTTIISVDERKIDADLMIYPNPTNGKFQIQLPGSGMPEGQVTVYNILGEEVFLKKFHATSASTFIIDLSEQRSGLYLVEVESANSSGHRKVLLK